MKTPEEMNEYFRSMPKKKSEPNPYWEFIKEPPHISVIRQSSENAERLADFNASIPTFKMIREFFRRFYESFHSEAQVLCVVPEDGRKLNAAGIPVLGKGKIEQFDVTIMVLPQDNHTGTSIIGEWFWQTWIIDKGIKPVARIHSHHILDPYQSVTDYSTLNSGTLEIVIGKIFDENLNICYWLDVPGTDIKAHTFIACENESGCFAWIPHKFHSTEETM